MTTDQVISTLNDLIQTSRDGELFLRTAAEVAEGPEFQHFCAEYADERAAFAAELEREVHRLGGTEEPPDTVDRLRQDRRVSGTVKIGLASAGRDRLLDMAEMGEDAAERAYEKALRAGLPAGTREVIEGQYHLIRRAHDHLSSLRHGRRAA
jgi:uncharacterized protein (TIGR02284 family)